MSYFIKINELRINPTAPIRYTGIAAFFVVGIRSSIAATNIGNHQVTTNQNLTLVIPSFLCLAKFMISVVTLLAESLTSTKVRKKSDLTKISSYIF